APGNSSVVNWPTPLVASANMSNPVARMTVFINNEAQQLVPVYTTERGVINTALKVFTGTHQMTVQATDTTGAIAQSTINVIGEPGDKAPNALMSVRNLSPNTVLACGVTSHDP